MGYSYLAPRREHGSAPRGTLKQCVALNVTSLATLLTVALLIAAVRTVVINPVQQSLVPNLHSASTVNCPTKPVLLSVPSSFSSSPEGESLPCIFNRSTTNLIIMKFLLINAQSFNTAKYDIKDIAESYDIDFVCVNETWESISESIKLPNYKTFSRPRPNSTHGGVAIFVKQSGSSFIVEDCDLYCDSDLEAIALSVKTNSQMTFDVVCAYVPPEKVDQLKCLGEKLCAHSSRNIVLLGDLNAKSTEWNNSQNNQSGIILTDILGEGNLTVHNDGQSTRRPSVSVIDLFATSSRLNHLVKTCNTLAHAKNTFRSYCGLC